MRGVVVLESITMVVVLLLACQCCGGEGEEEHGRISGVIIPGFASTQLRAWSMLDCPFSPLDFYPLDSVWLDTRKGTSRLMSNTFGSSLWMLPFSEHCHRDHVYWKSYFDVKGKEGFMLHCDEKEYISSSLGWPVDPMLHIQWSQMMHKTLRRLKTLIPIQRTFSIRKVTDGTIFKEISDVHPDSRTILYQLQKFYHNDSVLNPPTPWHRPPIKNIFYVYGIDLKTEVFRSIFYIQQYGKIEDLLRVSLHVFSLKA